MRMNLTPKDIERFWSKVDQSGGTEACWPFTGCCDSDGYGVLTLTRNNKWHTERAHRVSWVIDNGESPEGTPLIMHRCDNPPCCNPNHLNAGNNLTNVRDMLEKGRGTAVPPIKRGSDNFNAKLTESDVTAIRLAFSAGELQHVIGARYGIKQVTVSAIVHRRLWKHVP